MPHFPHDELDPARSHGDVLLSVCAGQRDTVVHTVRELMRSVAGHLTPRWSIDGFQSAGADRRPRTTLATCSPSATAPPIPTSTTRG